MKYDTAENMIQLMEHSLNLVGILFFIKDSQNNVIFPKNPITISKIEILLKQCNYHYNKKNRSIELYDSKNKKFYKMINNQYFLPNNHYYEIKIIQNISHLKYYEHLSKIDKITHLYNTRTIIKKLEYCIINIPFFTLVLCDIDDFKKINDTYTHTGGDIILKEVANILKQNIKNFGFVGRYGGDEFMIVLKTNQKEKIQKILKNIIDQVKKICIYYKDFEIGNITVSLGAYITNEEKEMKNQQEIEKYRISLFEKADEALYESKRSGKNKFIIIQQK